MDFKNNPPSKFKDADKLSEQEAQKEVTALREAIQYHDYLYYIKNTPAISDAAYDKLFRRLETLERRFPELSAELSPTARVGAKPVSRLRKVKHMAPMLSLEAVLEREEVEEFVQWVHGRFDEPHVRYMLEPKLDGLSVELAYQEGKFKYAATRGDGYMGEDISHNIKTLGSVPLVLQVSVTTSVRGEVMMRKDNFQALNKRRIEHGQEPFANPRNAAAGMMRQLDPRNVASDALDIYVYDILALDGQSQDSHAEILKKFSEWGLKTNPLNQPADSSEDVVYYYDKLLQQRDSLEYEIDGIVVKVDAYTLRDKLGTRERNPRWALAWKFPPREELTTLEDIVVQVGRTGMLTPVALLQPVDVGGVTVSRATLHNEDEVHRKDIRIGDQVRIIRAGDVIPEVKERVEQSAHRQRARPFSMPEKCPVCGTKVTREGAYTFCPSGLTCTAQLAGRIEHYASREAMDITHLGEKTVEQLVERNMAKSLGDLYTLPVEQLCELDGFAEKSARQLHDAIQNAKRAPLDRFLYALGIRHVGQRIARLLADRFKSLQKVRTASVKDYQNIPGVGQEIGRSVAEFFAQAENQGVLDHLLEAGIIVEDMPTRRAPEPLKGTTFVFTGSLAHYSRAEAKEHIEALGGHATSSISGETDYLVVGNNPGSKVKEAEDLGIQTLNEDEFEELMQRV